MDVTYTGAEPIEQPSLGLSWQPGETKTLDDETGTRLCTTGPFTAPPTPAPAPATDKAAGAN